MYTRVFGRIFKSNKVSNSQKDRLIIDVKLISFRKEHITVMINVSGRYSIKCNL